MIIAQVTLSVVATKAMLKRLIDIIESAEGWFFIVSSFIPATLPGSATNKHKPYQASHYGLETVFNEAASRP
ncbi:hypothetical protein [Paraburkholderia hayleyella]|uniref:hypothetical protein n=1 Tax=Paraburkholderia hayleyella TaxID=2152889 RepID=UPI001580D870|nr:hypothetical protein [Paraburkholderia hayleyella]